MDSSKDGIKAWLARYPERDRIWLAEQCGVSKSTVNNWLSTSIEVPAKAILIIENLMKADAEVEPKTAQEIVNLPATCTQDQFGLYTRAYKHSECEHFVDWITSRLDQAAAKELEKTDLHATLTASAPVTAPLHSLPPGEPDQQNAVG